MIQLIMKLRVFLSQAARLSIMKSFLISKANTAGTSDESELRVVEPQLLDISILRQSMDCLVS